MAPRGVSFVFDAHVPPGLAEALRVLGEPVEHVNEIFAPRTPDEVWIRYAADRGASILSRDVKITRTPHEALALREGGVGALFLLPGKTSPRFCTIIQTVVKHWPELKRIAPPRRVPSSSRWACAP